MGNNMNELYKAGSKKKKANKLTDWENEPLFDDLDADRINSSTSQELIRANLLKYEEIRNGGKEIKKSGPGKSTTRPLLVRKQNEYKYSAIETALLGMKELFNISGVGPEDVDSARQNQIVLNYQFRNKIKVNKLIEDIVRANVDEGTAICKVGWKTEYKMVMVEEEQPVYASPEESYQLMVQAVQSGQMSQETMIAMMETGEPMQTGVKTVEVEKEKLIVNHPTIDVRNSANIIIDPTCEGDIDNAQFLIEEYPISLAELKKEEYSEEEIETEITNPDGSIETKKEIKKKGIYKNLDLIDDNTEEFIYDEHNGYSAEQSKMTTKARKKLKAFEYWGFWDIHGDGTTVAIVATWVGKVLVRLEENPFSHKKIPYVISKYMPVKREVMGEPDAALLEENQDAVGRTTRAIQDIMANDAVGQEFIDETLFTSPVERENYRNGRTVFFRSGLNPKTAIYKNNVTPVNPIALQWIANQISDAESMSGTVLNNGQTNQSVSAQRRADSSNSKRESSVLRRIVQMLVDAARLILPMNADMLSEEEVVRNTNMEYIKISRDDLAGYHDIDIDIQTPEANAAIAQDLGMILQTGQQTMPPPVAMKIWARILKLKGQYDLSREIEDYKPEPDPKQQELMDMQIEEQRLKIETAKKTLEEIDSRIHERVSRVIENEKDVANKNSQQILREQQTIESVAKTEESKARAEESYARARKYNSEADDLDNNFIENRNGTNRARELEDRDIDYITKKQEKADDLDNEMTRSEMMLRIKQLEQQLAGSNKSN